MQQKNAIQERVRRRLESFALKSGIRDLQIHATMDLVKEAGFTSLQGLEFVLDLCEEFDFDFPANFNPFVDDGRSQGQTFDGLVKAVELHLSREGASDAKKR